MNQAKDLKERKSDGKEERTRRKNPTEGYRSPVTIGVQREELIGRLGLSC